MEAALKQGLAKFDMQVKSFCVKYQNVQWDDVHCGAWTAKNMIDLAGGNTVDQQMSALSWFNQNNVIEELIHSVSAQQPRDNSSDSLTTSESVSREENDFVLLDDREDDFVLPDAIMENEPQPLHISSGQFEQDVTSSAVVPYRLKKGQKIEQDLSLLKQDMQHAEIVVGDLNQAFVPYTVKINGAVYVGRLAAPRNLFMPDGMFVPDNLRMAILNDTVEHGANRPDPAPRVTSALVFQDASMRRPHAFFEPAAHEPESPETWLNGLQYLLNYIIHALNRLLDYLGVSEAYHLEPYDTHSTPVASSL